MNDLDDYFSVDDGDVSLQEDNGLESVLQSGCLEKPDFPIQVQEFVKKLKNRLYFDFDDTFVNTGLIKSRVLFRNAEKRGVSLERAEYLYSLIRKTFSLQLWSQMLADELKCDWALIQAQISDSLQSLFRVKVGKALIPVDSEVMVSKLLASGLPIRIITFGMPDYQMEKINLFMQELRSRFDSVLSAASPLRLFVDIVAPDGEEEFTHRWESSDRSILVQSVTHSGFSKAELLLQKHLNVGQRVVYVNDKRSENIDISDSGKHVLAVEIDRDGKNDDIPLDVSIVRIDTLAKLFTVLRDSVEW